MPRRRGHGGVLGADLVAKRIMMASKWGKVGARAGLARAASDLLHRSANLAPILSGDLIRSGRVIKRGSAAEGAYKAIVSYGTDHAVQAHEDITPAGSKQLGPWSSQKPGTVDGPVGGHFLSRPFRKHKVAYFKVIMAHVRAALIAGYKPL